MTTERSDRIPAAAERSPLGLKLPVWALGLLGCGGPMEDSWRAYVQNYVQDDGRVIDWRAQQTSTSESQAYTMTRALWTGDEAVFRTVQTWTVNNLQKGVPGALPGWRWGHSDDGTWTLLDAQPAADADQWLAWATLGAWTRWHRADDRANALSLLSQIWDEETLVTKRGRVLLPGPWARDERPVRLNPSYWLMFMWRDFAAADPAHDWASLIGPAYTFLAELSEPSGLAPNWGWMDPNTGALLPAPSGDEAMADFGFDAFRVAWTLAAEIKWHDERRAVRLGRPYRSLLKRWRSTGAVPAVLHRDGEPEVSWEYPGLYGALLPLWTLQRPKLAKQLDAQELCAIRAPHGWGDREDYYSQNWIWLGYALLELPRPALP